MGSFILHDRIAEKLEMARTMGVVADFRVSPVGPARMPDASVRVWRNPNGSANDETIKEYLTRLLEGLVFDHQIVVTPSLSIRETTREGSTQEAGLLAVPAAA